MTCTMRYKNYVVMFTLMCSLFCGLALTNAEESETNVEIELVLHEQQPSYCILDNDDTNLELERCLAHGEQLLEHLRPRKRMRRRKKVCPLFRDFISCMDRFVDNCPAIHNVARYEHVLHVHKVLRCACSEQQQECIDTLDCFQDEFRKQPVEQCDAMYRFNIDQKSKNKCMFLRHMVDCKHTLVHSRCGESAGLLSFNLMQMSPRYRLTKHPCPLTRSLDYQDVAYTAQCPASLTDEIAQCKRRHLDVNQLEFKKHYYIIVHGKRKSINASCRSYDDYQNCVRPLVQSCPDGVQRYYDYMDTLGIYLLKLQIICHDARDEYYRSLMCYKDHYRGILDQCTPEWKNTSDVISKTSAYEYYCEAETPPMKKLHSDLHNVIQCYKRGFNETCAVGPIAQLMNATSYDPRNLLFLFKPDCELHRAARHRTPVTKTVRETASPSASGDTRESVQRTDYRTSGVRAHGTQRTFHCAFVFVVMLIVINIR